MDEGVEGLEHAIQVSRSSRKARGEGRAEHGPSWPDLSPRPLVRSVRPVLAERL